jgi:hypothetical protein
MAAWLVAKHEPLQVEEAPYTEPIDDEIVVKNRAVAVNPVDWMKPYLGDLMFSRIKNLSNALAAGSFRPAPPPKVVGASLHDIQAALDIQRRGVSAAKIAVALD